MSRNTNFLPLGDGSILKVGGSHTKREVANFSARDADRLDDYQTRLTAIADVLRASVLETPPNVVEGNPFAAMAELIKAGRIANRTRALGLDLQRDFLDLFAASAGDFLDSLFESAPIKAAFGFDSVVGNYASPYTPGSSYVLLHHSFGEVNGKKGVWGHANWSCANALVSDRYAAKVKTTFSAACAVIFDQRMRSSQSTLPQARLASVPINH